MIYDWQHNDPKVYGMVIDLDKGECISGPNGVCCYVDEERGVWRRYVCKDGRFLIDDDGRLLVEEGRSARVKFFPFPYKHKVTTACSDLPEPNLVIKIPVD